MILCNRHRLLENFTGFVRYLAVNMSNQSCNIAVCQLTATNNKQDNLKIVQKLVLEASQKNAKIVFLPEGCDYIASNKDETTALAESLDGQLMGEYKSLALKHNVWLSIGGFHEIGNSEDALPKINNAHVLINDEGKIRAVYRKLHLFDLTLPEKNLYLKESSYALGGTEIVPPVETPAGQLGLSICYDLRFPELSTILRKQGASILTYPSAFTSSTGLAHWEVLLRSRAIENQCYVVAAAQYGKHNSKRISHGQSVIIDPWGKIIAECPAFTSDVPSNESVAVASVDSSIVKKIRQEMPVFEHRRNDLYTLNILNNPVCSIEDNMKFMFSNKVIPPCTVFYRTEYSFAFTNIRCVVPGHVLVASLRPAPRLSDLNREEVADLFETAVKVQKQLEKVHSANSSTICVQDGKDAGQTVKHVHCHILPRKLGDFDKNDDIYLELAKHDRDNNSGPIRSLEEMSEEANFLRRVLG